MHYVLGVDGGASKTHALVLEETGKVLGFGMGGSSNHQVAGIQAAMGEVERAVNQAMNQADLQSHEIEVGCFCLAGADLKEDYAMLQDSVEAFSFTQSVMVKNDTIAALRSGLTQSWGVVVICGTGFNAAGIARDGKEIILPGLGTISGDWGGGYELSQEMIRLVMRAWDGRGKPTLLTDLVLEGFSVSSIEDLLSKLYHQKIGYQRQLELVPLLFEAAEADDGPARDLIIQLGLEVGVTANTLIRRLSLENEAVEVVLAGSVFKGKGALLLETISRAVLDIAPKAKLIRPRFEPVVGAALLALERINVSTKAPFMSQLENSLPEKLIITG